MGVARSCHSALQFVSVLFSKPIKAPEPQSKTLLTNSSHHQTPRKRRPSRSPPRRQTPRTNTRKSQVTQIGPELAQLASMQLTEWHNSQLTQPYVSARPPIARISTLIEEIDERQSTGREHRLERSAGVGTTTEDDAPCLICVWLEVLRWWTWRRRSPARRNPARRRAPTWRRRARRRSVVI